MCRHGCSPRCNLRFSTGDKMELMTKILTKPYQIDKMIKTFNFLDYIVVQLKFDQIGKTPQIVNFKDI